MANLVGTLLTPSSWWPASDNLILFVVTTIVLVIANSLRRPAFPQGAWVIKGWPVFGSPQFFSARDKFLKKGKADSPNGHFSFYYGRHPIVSVSGDEGRHALYTSRGLDLVAAVRVLFTPGPDFDKLLGRDMSSHFKGVFRRMTNKSDLSVTLPGLIMEVDAKYRNWDISGPFDPFSNMFPLVYSMIHRGIGCLDMALKPEETMLTFFTMIISSPTGVMFPTLPTPSGMLKIWSTIRIYRLVGKIVAERKRTGKRENDALQFMIDNGDSNLIMFLYLAGAVSVALANTSMQVAWLQCFLASDPYWYAKTREEVDGVVARNRVSADESPVDVLLRLTPDQWENDFPIIHAGMTDSIRMVLPGPSIRKNISGKDLVMGKTGVVVPADAFVLYAFHDIHFDPNIYEDPYKWNPARYLDGEQGDKKPAHSYLGWGSGLHPCLGMKLAKLFVTITTAMFVTHFDFKLTDEKGEPSTEPLPLPGMNGREALGPVTGVFLKCERRF